MVGRTISNYRIVERVGEGGMGVVYRAEDERLGRSVALKFLAPGLIRDEGARARFFNEARAASALEHRNVCGIYDIGETEDGQLFLVMPFYEGQSLQRRIQRGPIPPAEAIGLLVQVCAGLVKAHEKGILHRDLKPANVFVTEDGEVKILDFGVAKLSDATRLTRTGSVVGTLAYMAPEQLLEERATVHTEIWSLGVILFETLTGELPFRATTQGSMVAAILRQRPDLAALREVAGPALRDVVGRCLCRSPADRYPSVAALVADLEQAARLDAPPGVVVLEAGVPTETFLSPVSQRARPEPTPGPAPRTDSTASSETDDGSRPFSRVVVREGELEALRGWLAAAERDGVRVALLRGEEGRGKSTLAAELCRRAEAGGAFVSASGACNAQSGAADPYLPFREILAQLSGQLQAQELAGRRTQVHLARVHRLGPAVVEEIMGSGRGLIGTFISPAALLERGRRASSPESTQWVARLEAMVEESSSAASRGEVDRAQLFEEYTRVLQRTADRQPLVLVVEDLHWADEGTVALFSHLARNLGSSPVFLLGTYRHEEVASLPGRERHPFASVVNEITRQFGAVELDLDASDGQRFVDQVLDAEPNRLDATFRRRLFGCTGGVPLFTTELLRELRDAEILVRDEEGRWTLSGEVDWELLPRRVEAVVAERVGRLPEELRAILTTASVQGEEFSAEIAALVLGSDPREAVRLLSNEAARRYRIVTASGVRRVGGQRHSLYRFRHSLFRKYLYESLDPVEVAVQHEDTAEQMQSLYGEHDDEVVAQLAHHYRQAGITEKAVEYLRRAGVRAAHLSAHGEAVRLFETALGELESLPRGQERMERELEILTVLASVQIAVHGFGSEPVEATYLRARDLCERLPGASDFPLLWGLFAFSSVRGEFERSLPLAHRMLEGADGGDDPLRLVQSRYAVGVSEFFVGHVGPALEHLEAAAGPRDPELGQALVLAFSQDTRKVAAAYASWVRWLCGDPRGALEGAREAVRWARQDPHPFTLSTVLLLTGFVRVLAGDAEAARAQGEEMARLSEEFGLFQTAEAELLRALGGLVAPEGGQRATLRRLAGAVTEYRQRQWVVFVPFLLGLLARAHLSASDEASASDHLAEAWTVSERGGERFWAADLLLVRGELAVSREARVAAARQALELAREQGAGWLELRAAVAVARAEGDYGPLAEVVQGFPVEPEIPDLAEARAVLAGEEE